MVKNEVKWGALLSYLLIIINACYGFLVTPYILSAIGEADYGVYKTITALSSSLMILDFGLGGTVMRYIAKYRSEKNDSRINGFISMALGEGAIIIGVLALVSVVIYALIPDIYSNGLLESEIALAKKLFAVMAFNMLFHIVENVFNGIISGYNKFTFANGMKLLRILIRIALLFIVFAIWKNALALVLIDFVLTIVLIAAELLYIKRVLGAKIRLSFRNWDMEVFKESFRYTALLFLTTIAAQINNNLDNVVIGALQGSAFVSVYSMGLLIFGMFEQLSTAISGVMLPTVANILSKENAHKEIQSTVVSVGRIQFILLGAAFTGFAIIGRQFISLWLGDGFEDVYVIAMILIAPALLELCVNVCLSVLRAKNMLGFRTAVLFSVTVLNAIITIAGMKRFGYYAAAAGTATSFILGSLVVMNIYYTKKLSFNMLKIYGSIFKNIWLCLLLAGGALAFAAHRINGGWLQLIICIGVFSVVYGATLLLFGLNREEKKQLPVIKKYIK